MYDLRRGENISAILSDFYSGHRVNAEEDIYGDLLEPQGGGNRQTVSLRIHTLESAEAGLKLFYVSVSKASTRWNKKETHPTSRLS